MERVFQTEIQPSNELGMLRRKQMSRLGLGEALASRQSMLFITQGKTFLLQAENEGRECLTALAVIPPAVGEAGWVEWSLEWGLERHSL